MPSGPKLGARDKDERVGINLARASKRGIIGNLASTRDNDKSSRPLLTPTGRDRKSVRPKAKVEEGAASSTHNNGGSIRKGGDTHGMANLSLAPQGLALRNNRPEHTMVSVDPKKPMLSEKTRLTQRAEAAEKVLADFKATFRASVAAAVAEAEDELSEAKDLLDQRQVCTC